jgi:NAD(P)H-hydrate epimerase
MVGCTDRPEPSASHYPETMSTITAEALAKLLKETAERHHQAFIESDGADPDWALWYAPYLQAHLWDGGGRLPTRSELVYLLVGAERAHRASGSDEPWPVMYARHLLAELGEG